jgi:hypothetical protein
MIIERNNSKTLMIHSYISSYFNTDAKSEFNLDLIYDPQKNSLTEKFLDLTKDYIFTFDDGLYQQYQILKLFPKDRTIFFPSFGLLRPNNTIPVPVENSIAHCNKKLYLSTFMTSVEVWDSMLQGYKLGAHGWYHLNLNLNHPDINNLLFTERIKLLKDDAKKCSEAYLNYIKKDMKKYIINNELELYFCTPYNILNENQNLYINFLANFLEKNLINSNINIPIRLKIFSNERISIENFLSEINTD